MIYGILFDGKRYVFNSYDSTIAAAVMYRCVKNNENNDMVISNRIFETIVYDWFIWFISVEKTTSSILVITILRLRQEIRDVQMLLWIISESSILLSWKSGMEMNITAGKSSRLLIILNITMSIRVIYLALILIRINRADCRLLK